MLGFIGEAFIGFVIGVGIVAVWKGMAGGGIAIGRGINDDLDDYYTQKARDTIKDIKYTEDELKNHPFFDDYDGWGK